MILSRIKKMSPRQFEVAVLSTLSKRYADVERLKDANYYLSAKDA